MGFFKKVFNAVTDAAGAVGDFVSSAVQTVLPFSFGSSNTSNSSNMGKNNFLTNTFQGLVGSGINYLFNLQGMKDQNKIGQENAKYWAKYNSPIMQMQRLQEAGLNPNLVYGEGANAQFAGNTNNPTMHGINTRYMTSLELASLKADVANKDKTNSNLDAQNDLLKSQKRAQDIANREAEARNPELFGAKALELREADIEAKNIANKINRELARIGVDKEMFLDNSLNQYAHDLTRNLLLEVEYQYADAKARLQNGVLASEQKLNLKKIEQLKAEIPYLSAQAAAARALADNYVSASNLNDKKAMGESLKNLMLYFDSYFGKYGLNKGLAGDVLRPIMRMIDDVRDKVGFKNGDWSQWNYFEEFNRQFEAQFGRKK